MSRSWWRGWTRRGDALTPVGDPSVSFAWPRDTDLTREQLAIAMRDEAAAASSAQPDAGRTVETTAQDAPRPQQWQDGPTPLLADVTGEPYGYGKTLVYGDTPEAHGIAASPGRAMRDYAESLAGVVRPTGGPDALDSKQQIRAQLAACRGDCGDGPCGCEWEEWAR